MADHFTKKEAKAFSTFDQPYDYGSIMHGGKTFLSRNGEETIIPKKALVSTRKDVILFLVTMLLHICMFFSLLSLLSYR